MTTSAAPANSLSVLETLDELEEFFASGFMSRAGMEPAGLDRAQVMACMAEGIYHHLANVPLPPYRGEVFYPSGCNYWDNGAVVWHHYVQLRMDRNRLSAKREHSQSDAERDALDALESFWAEWPGAGGYTHSIPRYGRILSEGLDGYEARIKAGLDSAKQEEDAEKEAFYQALLRVIEAVRILHHRLLVALETAVCESEKQETNRLRIVEALRQVPFHPASSFFQAMVATHFIFTLDGCDDVGRFDQDLFPYYEAGLDAGQTSRGEALELTRALWQHVDDCFAWNCAIGGSKPDGSDASNELTLVAMEAAHARRRPNLALRLRQDSPDEVWEAALDTIATGCGLPALYCEENYFQALRRAGLGIREEDFAHLAFGGCTETMIHGRSNVGSLDSRINLPRVLEKTLHEHLPECRDFDQIVQHYKETVRRDIEQLTEAVSGWQETKANYYPQLVRSLLIDDCIDAGREYAAGGARYNWSVINVEGLANVIDSLCAVREIVYEKKEASAKELLAALKADFEGHEGLRRKLEQCPRYGTGDDKADRIAEEVSSFVFREFLDRRPWRGGKFLPACLMFVTYANAGKEVGATPDGRGRGEPIADSAGAYHGRDRNGPTALLRSVTSLDQEHAPGTLVVNVRFAKKVFRAQDTREKLKGLIRAYFKMGGMQIQIGVVDQAVLKDAWEHPDRHQDLIIRIGGYSEYWNRLSRDLQRTVLERTEHE